ncbi:MAG: SH3 domain-containing protein [Chloroflexi bacterium]|nr:SH3 domain-containing protein [Chloroflexota bacterium]
MFWRVALQGFGELWRWFVEQSSMRQAVLLATPIVVVALIALGMVVAFSAVAPAQPSPTVVVLASPSPTPLGHQIVVISTASPVPATSPGVASSGVASAGVASPGVVSVSPVASPIAMAALPTVVVPTPSLPPTPEPTASPTPAPPPATRAKVANTDGLGANLRNQPSATAQRVKLLPEGTQVNLVGAERQVSGQPWRNVRDDDGNTGWILSEYLQPIQLPPGVTPTLPPPSIKIEEITSPAARGSEATLTIVTRPGTRCEVRLLVFGPSALPTEGLGPKTADGDGVCSWTWTVPENIVPGTWRYRIFAGEGENVTTREVPLVIT